MNELQRCRERCPARAPPALLVGAEGLEPPTFGLAVAMSPSSKADRPAAIKDGATHRAPPSSIGCALIGFPLQWRLGLDIAHHGWLASLIPGIGATTSVTCDSVAFHRRANQPRNKAVPSCASVGLLGVDRLPDCAPARRAYCRVSRRASHIDRRWG